MIVFIVLFLLLCIVLGFLSGFLPGYISYLFSTNNNNRNNTGINYLYRYNTYVYPQQTTPIFYTAPVNRTQPQQNQQHHQQQQQGSQQGSQHQQQNPFSRAQYYHLPSNNQIYPHFSTSDLIMTTGPNQQHPQPSNVPPVFNNRGAPKPTRSTPMKKRPLESDDQNYIGHNMRPLKKHRFEDEEEEKRVEAEKARVEMEKKEMERMERERLERERAERERLEKERLERLEEERLEEERLEEIRQGKERARKELLEIELELKQLQEEEEQEQEQEQEQENIVCSICYDEIEDSKMATINCGHKFCHECIIKSSKIKKECPLCRQSIRSIKIRRTEFNIDYPGYESDDRYNDDSFLSGHIFYNRRNNFSTF
ncbi:hypothetical protein DICPUDRAFT_147203 [Dictyostelium purpureum]|uniref:RING-type domain-containing protein n=1 Tax=Dictyostelium purpureum TaxID=5786 RepID=F0Z7X5_DICPU|nr:uncharacterized protein DICPUDRAFT_147203 [Dictyostelium purpureum]EGC39985.1 hypothetical protein DICPUDRAFT_147203 [Dictyostelium purpureum]|eukprot:XP_003283488.1 hypothetical protein DICPUDRAFT_147203 [Dictyostelium purpureum]